MKVGSRSKDRRRILENPIKVHLLLQDASAEDLKEGREMSAEMEENGKEKQ
jgi:hypothetical protein